MSADHSRDQSHHQQLYLVSLSRLTQLIEELLCESLRVIDQINGQEIGRVLDFALTLLLTFVLLDNFVDLGHAIFSHFLGAFVFTEDHLLVVFFITRVLSI